MSERDGFLRAICENPADDVARLVFADWLQENGEPERAAYIRWQLKGRFTHPFPRVSFRKWFTPWWTSETRRRHVMMDNNVPTLLLMKVRTISQGIEHWNQAHVTRGFVSRAELPVAAFVDKAESLFRTHPITDVRPRDVKPWNSSNYRWGWSNQAADRVHNGPNWILPEELFALLPTEKCVHNINENRRWWDSEHEARVALNVACVRYGRKLAGLPPPPIAAPAV